MLKWVRRSFGAMRMSVFAVLAARLLWAQEPEEDDLEIPAAPVTPAGAPRPRVTPPSAPEAAPAGAPEDEPAADPVEGDFEVPSAAPSAPPAVEPAPAAPIPALPSPDPTGPRSAPPAARPTLGLPAEPPVITAGAQAPDDTQRAVAAAAWSTGNFEVTAHSRPAPLGLVLSGFVQAQFVRNQISEDQLQQDGLPLNRDELVLRAARLRIDGGYTHTAYTLELDASTSLGPQVGIRRAEATVLYRGIDAATPTREHQPPLLALTAGVTDLPFGYELVESSRSRVFMERSLGSEALFPTQMDVGLKLHGGWRFLRYGVALVNGQPVEVGGLPRDPNAAKDIVGRFGAEVAMADSVVISGGTSFGFGKGFHRGRVAVKDAVAWRDDNNDGVAVPNEIIGVPGSAATPSENFERWALGLDLQLQIQSALGATRLFAEAFVASNHDRGFVVSDPVDVGFDVRQLGGYLALTQDITPYVLAGFRVATYDPSSDFFEERRGDVVPRAQGTLTLSPVLGLALPDRGRLLCQYDFVQDELARDGRGIPTDAENHQLTLRLQVDL